MELEQGSITRLFLGQIILCFQYCLLFQGIMLIAFIMLQVGVPGYILRCLEHMELKDSARLVAFLAKMTGHRPLVVQLIGKGLLDPARMRRLFDRSSPREVTMDVLMIVSDLARMDKVSFRPIPRDNFTALFSCVW